MSPLPAAFRHVAVVLACILVLHGDFRSQHGSSALAAPSSPKPSSKPPAPRPKPFSKPPAPRPKPFRKPPAPRPKPSSKPPTPRPKPSSKPPAPRPKPSSKPPTPRSPSPSSTVRMPVPKPKAAAPPPVRPSPHSLPIGTCRDLSTSCPQFASLGYCTSRPVYMVGTATIPGNCLASCNKCPQGAVPNSPAPKLPKPKAAAPKPHPPAPKPKAAAPPTAHPSPPAPSKAGPKPTAAPRPSSRPPPRAPLVLPTTGNMTILSAARGGFCLAPHPVGGRTLIATTCDGSVKQLWTWSTVRKTLANAGSGLCITYNSNLANGSKVSLQACTKPAVSPLQQWSYTPFTYGPLTPASDGSWCLQMTNLNATDGAGLSVWSCAVAQQDRAVGKFFLFALLPPKCSDLSPMCPVWKREGRCSSDPLFTVGNQSRLGICRVSCNGCPVAPPPLPPLSPPRPGSINRPPRGGGAQGGGICVDTCPWETGYVAINSGGRPSYCYRAWSQRPVVSSTCSRTSNCDDYYRFGGNDNDDFGSSYQCCLNGCRDTPWQIQQADQCYTPADIVPLCGAEPLTGGKYSVLQRHYTDGAGVVRPGWNTQDLSYTDGNVAQATFIMNLLPELRQDDPAGIILTKSRQATLSLAPLGVEGTVDMFRINWDRASGEVITDPSGRRSARGNVFRTNTDVFVHLPGEDSKTSTLSIQITSNTPDFTGYVDVLERPSGGYASGTGDWAALSEWVLGSIYPLNTIRRGLARGYNDMFYVLKNNLTVRINAKVLQLQPEWDPDRNPDTDVKIFFIGYGQGATLAAIAAAHFNILHYPIGGVYLFGDPTVAPGGDVSFRNLYKKSGLWDKTFRILNSNDVVSVLPPNGAHVGRTIVFCQDDMHAYDDVASDTSVSSRCAANIGYVTSPYISLDVFAFLADISAINTRFPSVIQLHDPAFYATSAWQYFSTMNSPDMAALLSAWTPTWQRGYCLSDTFCDAQCQGPTAVCGPGTVCAPNFVCALPAPPPPCVTWWGAPCTA